MQNPKPKTQNPNLPDLNYDNRSINQKRNSSINTTTEYLLCFCSKIHSLCQLVCSENWLTMMEARAPRLHLGNRHFQVKNVLLYWIYPYMGRPVSSSGLALTCCKFWVGPHLLQVLGWPWPVACVGTRCFWLRCVLDLSLIHIWRCRRYAVCRSRWSPYH